VVKSLLDPSSGLDLHTAVAHAVAARCALLWLSVVLGCHAGWPT
jgi:hypothetical protein